MRPSNGSKRAGAIVTEEPVPAFDRQGEYFKGGGFAGAEAYAIHRTNARPHRRIRPARRQARAARQGPERGGLSSSSAAARRSSCARSRRSLAPFDAILHADRAVHRADRSPRPDASDEDYFRWNDAHPAQQRPGQLPRRLRGLRCPATQPGDARRSGLMVSGPAMSDRRILAVAAAIERALARD